MKVAVCTPHTGTIRTHCAGSLNALVAHTLSTPITYNGTITRPQFGFFYEEVGPLEYKRTKLARRALEWGCDYALLIDWDMVFPPDAFLRLAAHDRPVVAGNYRLRHGVPNPSAFRGQDRPAYGTGLEEVCAVGMGLCLVKAHVFSTTPQPWFTFAYDGNGNCTTGEDVHFCNQVRSAGHSVFVDHDLPVGHIAETILSMTEDDNARASPPKTGNQQGR